MYRHDGNTTYCYLFGRSYTEEYPSRSDGDLTFSTVGTECPLIVTVNYPDQVDTNTKIPISVTVVLNTAKRNPAFAFPNPIAASNVPTRLAGKSKSPDKNPLDGSAKFEIPVANIVVCDWRTCDIFQDLSKIGNSYHSSNLPQNLDKKKEVFTSSEIMVSKAGKYTGFVHLVVNIAGNSRADFVTFFPVQVGDPAGPAPTAIVTDGVTTYCWLLKNEAPSSDHINADLTVRTGAYCPASMQLSVSNAQPKVGDVVTAAWSVRISETPANTSLLLGEISSTYMYNNLGTGKYSAVPLSLLSTCRTDAPNANCSSYSGGNSTTFDVQTFYDRNFTAGSTNYTMDHKFEIEGNYLIISRVSMPTLDGDRIDIAVYNSVQVYNGSMSTNSIFLYVGLGIGALILLATFLFFYFRNGQIDKKRKSSQQAFPENLLDEPSSQNFKSPYPAGQNYFGDGSRNEKENEAIKPIRKERDISVSSTMSEKPHSFSLDSLRPSSFCADSSAASSNFYKGSENSVRESSNWKYSESASDLTSFNSKLSDVSDFSTKSHNFVHNTPILEENDASSEDLKMRERDTNESDWGFDSHK